MESAHIASQQDTRVNCKLFRFFVFTTLSRLIKSSNSILPVVYCSPCSLVSYRLANKYNQPQLVSLKSSILVEVGFGVLVFVQLGRLTGEHGEKPSERSTCRTGSESNPGHINWLEGRALATVPTLRERVSP